MPAQAPVLAEGHAQDGKEEGEVREGGELTPGARVIVNS